jgi:hypothetical protein
MCILLHSEVGSDYVALKDNTGFYDFSHCTCVVVESRADSHGRELEMKFANLRAKRAALGEFKQYLMAFIFTNDRDVEKLTIERAAGIAALLRLKFIV